MNILLTGASGFVGRAATKYYATTTNNLVFSVRQKAPEQGASFFEVGEINAVTEWTQALKGIECVIHLAARAHVMDDDKADPLAAYREVNTTGTLNLARQAADAGVKRFVFISSIKVNGESTTHSPSFEETDVVSTRDPYGLSKAEAEEGLWLIATETGMEVVIIRPPLIYGPGVKANFLNLMKLAATGWPLPFGAIKNKRSMIYIGNLVDYIARCVDHPAAANQVFLISDGRDLSLSELLTQLRHAMGKSARLFSVPVFLFHLAGKVLSKQGLIERLVGDLQVDSSKANELLDWTPPYSVEQGIQATVADFLAGNK